MPTLLKGGLVYDGTGAPPREADVLIQRSSIARIAPRLNVRARTTIEAKGKLVMPGFVDAVSYADRYEQLIADPSGTELITRGITSVVVGHGGVSLAPLTAGALAPLAWWGRPSAGAVHAMGIGELFTLLKGRMGVNVGSLIGFATVREGILRGETRDCTDREFAALEAALEKGLEEGALGVSLNLEHPHLARVPRHELTAAARIAEAHGKLLAIRMREREERLLAAFNEIKEISKATRANVLITDLEPYTKCADEYRELLAHVTRASAEHHVHFSTNGRGITALPLPLLLPPHFRVPDWDAMTRRLHDHTVRDELRAYLGRYRGVPLAIASVADPTLKLFEGTSFDAWSLHEHLPFEDALMRFMIASGLRAVVTATVGDEELAGTFAAHDRALIASGDAAAPALESSPHLSFLTHARSARIPLEQAIAKMTSLPAAKAGIEKRGVLREGAAADVLVVEEGALRDAFVNGTRVLVDGLHQAERPGVILKR